jgi:hypothetical protein
MSDWPSLSEEQDIAPKPGHVWITRRRWDAYFLAAAAVAAVIGTLAFQSSMWIGIRAIGGLASFAMIWAIVRWSWPRRGTAVPTLSATSGTIPILWWLATWGLLLGLGGGALLHVLVPMPVQAESWDMRSAIIWAGLAMGWFVGLLVGRSRIERHYRKPQTYDDRLLE